MNKLFPYLVVIILAILCGIAVIRFAKQSPQTPRQTEKSSGTESLSDSQKPVVIKNGNLKLTSPFFNDSESIPPQFSCVRDNDNPELDISGIPPQAKSLALTVEDPDAPNGTWYHWLVFNLPPDTTQILEHSEPATVGTGSNGKTEFAGPCPPDAKTHHYIFTLYALNQMMDLSNTTTVPDFQKQINGHVIEQTELTGTFTGPVK